MVTCFLKPTEATGVACEIRTYWARLWLGKNGTASVLACIVVHNSCSSSQSLETVSVLIPRGTIRDVKDETEWLCGNPESPFHRFKMLGYKLVDAERRIVNDDGVDNVVFSPNNRFFVRRIAECTLLTVHFAKPIPPGGTAEVVYRYNVNGLCQILESGNALSCDLGVFATGGLDALGQLAVDQREIPVCLSYPQGTEGGGFDILLHIPPDMEVSSASEPSLQIISDLDEFGETGLPRDEVVWHLDEILQEKGQVTFEDVSDLYLTCAIRRRTAGDFDLVKKQVANQKLLAIVGIVLGGLAFIISLIALLLPVIRPS